MRHKLLLAIGLGLMLSLILTPISVFAGEVGDLRGKVLRIHILANSDSELDQAEKLKVRDAVLEAGDELFRGCATKREALETAEGHIDELIAAAEGALRGAGSAHAVTAAVKNLYFDTRVYDGYTLPSGRYDALQFKIGAGGGRNWWCVMYPALCIPAASGADADAVFTEGERDMVEHPAKYKIKFAVVELANKIGEGIRGLFGG